MRLNHDVYDQVLFLKYFRLPVYFLVALPGERFKKNDVLDVTEEWNRRWPFDFLLPPIAEGPSRVSIEKEA